MNPVKFDSNYPLQQVRQSVVYFRAFVICLGGLFFGYNNASFNPTQEHICNINGWFTDEDIALYTGIITAFLPFGCMVGSLLSNSLLNITQSNLRVCLAIADLIGLVGTVVQIIDPNLGNFIVGRFLNGISGGFNTTLVPIYLNNFTPVIMRGKTGTFLQTFASFGLFVGFCFGAFQPRYTKTPKDQIKSVFITEQMSELSQFEDSIAWRITIGFPIILCVIRFFFLIFFYKEETPIQMVKTHHLRTLKNYLYRCYDKDRAELRFKEIVQYARSQDDDNNNSEEDEKDQEYHVEFTSQKPQKNEPQDPKQLITIQHTDQNQHHSINNDEAQHSTHEKHDHLELKIGNIQSQNDQILEKVDSGSSGSSQSKKQKIVYKSQRRRKYLGIVLQMVAQLSGLNALMFYSSSIYKANSDNLDTVQMYLYIQGFAIFFFTFIAIFFIERFGRVKLIMVSTVLTLIGLFGIAIFSIIDIFAISFVFIIFFLFGFGIGLGAVIWPFCAEVVNKEDLPLCTAIRWTCTLFIGISFRFIVNGMGISGAFFIFFGFTLAAFLYFLKEIKETKGLTTIQVDELFAK